MKYFGAHGHLTGHLPGLFVVVADDIDDARQRLKDALELFATTLDDVHEELLEIKSGWAVVLEPTIEHIIKKQHDYYTYLGRKVYYFEV